MLSSGFVQLKKIEAEAQEARQAGDIARLQAALERETRLLSRFFQQPTDKRAETPSALAGEGAPS